MATGPASIIAARFGALLLRAALIIGASLPAGAIAATTPQGEMLPDRLLECTVGLVTNFDPAKDQTAAELHYDGFHRLVLFLASNHRLVGRPPDAIEDAPKVDVRTRVVEDPDHITAQPSDQFGRLIDMWPDRVETSTPIGGDMLNAIVLTPIDIAAGTATLFMLRASELTHYDPRHIYHGTCQIRSGQPKPGN